MSAQVSSGCRTSAIRKSAGRDSCTAAITSGPGSRRSEIERLMPVFGQVLHRVAQHGRRMEVILPAVSHLEGAIREELRSWPYKPEVVLGDQPKLAAFRRARAALVASGTATLELALAGVPMVVAYKVSRVEELAKYLISVNSIVLANLVLGENAFPEFIQERCEPERLLGTQECDKRRHFVGAVNWGDRPATVDACTARSI